MATPEMQLPSFKELKVPIEINLTTPYLRAAALHMHTYCEPKCYEFMLCRQEEGDPRKCLKEGKDVTNCGVQFLQKVKKNCRKEYDTYAGCMEHRSGGRFLTARCRSDQRAFDECLWEKMGMDRPLIGQVSKTHIHSTDRIKPNKERDYEAEAAKVMTAAPHAAVESRQHYANVKEAAFDWFSDI